MSEIKLASPVAELGLSQQLSAELKRCGYGTVGKLTASTRTGIAARFFGKHLAAIDAALAKHALAFEPSGGRPNICKTCPKCTTCGNPRTSDPKQVVTLNGRYKHHGFQAAPTCDECHAHHRSIVAASAAA